MQNEDFRRPRETMVMNIESEKSIIPFKKLQSKAKIPTRAYPGDAGLDLYALEDTDIQPGKIHKISMGIATKLNEGTYGKISPTSGLSSQGIVVITGIIDNGYTGEIFVQIHNNTKKICNIKAGAKIAQMIIVKCDDISTPEEVTELPKTARGSKGFGSSSELSQVGTEQLINVQGKIHGQVFPVLIDSGAQDDFISQELVDKLQLITSPITAFKAMLANGAKMVVDKQVKSVLLHIGPYIDQLDLQVLDTGHPLILGKKWLRRINPHIDWRTNDVSFKFQGKQITLLSATNNPTVKTISAIQFARELKKDKDDKAYLCFIQTASIDTHEDFHKTLPALDPDLRELLQRYPSIFPDDLPGLPPKRAVDHHI